MRPAAKTDQGCKVTGCYQSAVAIVTKSGRSLSVCLDCAAEMSALYGWRRI